MVLMVLLIMVLYIGMRANNAPYGLFPFYLYHGLLPFTGLCYSSSYLPIEANESEAHSLKIAYFRVAN